MRNFLPLKQNKQDEPMNPQEHSFTIPSFFMGNNFPPHLYSYPSGSGFTSPCVFLALCWALSILSSFQNLTDGVIRFYWLHLFSYELLSAGLVNADGEENYTWLSWVLAFGFFGWLSFCCCCCWFHLCNLLEAKLQSGEKRQKPEANRHSKIIAI